MKRVFSLVIIICCISLAACTKVDLFEQKISFPAHSWAGNNRLQFTYTVEDSTNSYYNVYFIVRHTEKYNYNNIWLNFTMIAPNDTSKSVRLNVPLADVNGWVGTAMDDVIEQRSLITRNPVHLQPGTYHLFVQQIMREDPLENILQAGLRVEKVVQ